MNTRENSERNSSSYLESSEGMQSDAYGTDIESLDSDGLEHDHPTSQPMESQSTTINIDGYDPNANYVDGDHDGFGDANITTQSDGIYDDPTMDVQLSPARPPYPPSPIKQQRSPILSRDNILQGPPSGGRRGGFVLKEEQTVQQGLKISHSVFFRSAFYDEGEVTRFSQIKYRELDDRRQSFIQQDEYEYVDLSAAPKEAFPIVRPNFQMTKKILPDLQFVLIQKYFSKDGTFHKFLAYKDDKFYPCFTDANGQIKVNTSKPLDSSTGNLTYAVVYLPGNENKIQLRIFTGPGTGHFYMTINNEALKKRLEDARAEYLKTKNINKEWEWFRSAKLEGIELDPIILAGDMKFSKGKLVDVNANSGFAHHGYNLYVNDTLPEKLAPKDCVDFLFIKSSRKLYYLRDIPADTPLHTLNLAAMEVSILNVDRLIEALEELNKNKKPSERKDFFHLDSQGLDRMIIQNGGFVPPGFLTQEKIDEIFDNVMALFPQISNAIQKLRNKTPETSNVQVNNNNNQPAQSPKPF